MRHVPSALAGCAFAITFIPAIPSITVAAGPQIVGLGQLSPTGDSAAYAVSADGRVVVGGVRVASGFIHAFRWTDEQGMVDLGVMPGATTSRAVAVSGNGTKIVGVGGVSDNVSFVWTEASGMTPIEAPDYLSNAVSGMSRDGSVIVGSALNASYHHAAFVYIDGALQVLPRPAGGLSWYANGVSADGRIIVGDSVTATGATRAVQWGLQGPAADLGALPLTADGTLAVSANVDGSVIVGTTHYSYPYVMTHLMKWTAQTGVQDWGGVVLHASVLMPAISDDGGFVGGYAISSECVSDAYVWESGQFRPAKTYFAARGVDLTGWDLATIEAVSPDGNVVVGIGRHGASTEAYVVRLSGTCGSADFDNDTAPGTNADIEAFFRCIAGDCCASCGSADFNGDGAVATDQDIESFFRVLAGGSCEN